jgi:uncharacterized SAM-binding protein YcdF (DUF218 family)
MLFKEIDMSALKKGLIFLAVLAAAEAAGFARVLALSSRVPPAADMVLVYSGTEGRAAAGLEWTEKLGSIYFLYSGWDLSDPGHELARLGPLRKAQLLLEGKARTTDQNARYCAPLIRSTGVRSVALVLPWYHLPRAYFLTWFYLRGTGIHILPYASGGVPVFWWCRPLAWYEMAKFWGSLGRMVLCFSN